LKRYPFGAAKRYKRKARPASALRGAPHYTIVLSFLSVFPSELGQRSEKNNAPIGAGEKKKIIHFVNELMMGRFKTK
jgi:hypothetical protein